MFYVASANLVLAFVISLFHGLGGLTADAFWLPFLGGLIWAVSGFCACTATNNLGMAKAFGIWASLNIVVSLICGRVLFGEFKNPDTVKLLLLVLAVATIIAGLLLIIFAKGGVEKPQDRRSVALGLLGALGAGILWGIYYIPIKMSGASMWIAAAPMAVGIFAGSGILLLLGRESPRMGTTGQFARVIANGVLWTLGNYGMLLLVGELGAGKG